MHQQSHFELVRAHEMKRGSSLHFLIVHTQLFPTRQIFLKSLGSRRIDGCRMAVKFVHRLLVTLVAVVDILDHVLEDLDIFMVARLRKGRQTLSWIPHGCIGDSAQPISQFIIVIRLASIPIGTVPRRKFHQTGNLVFHVPRHRFLFQILTHTDDIETNMLFCQFFKGKEIDKTKMLLLFPISFP